jgi:hypothetical protein
MDADVKVIIEGVETAFGVEFQKAEINDDTTLDDLFNVLTLRIG